MLIPDEHEIEHPEIVLPGLDNRTDPVDTFLGQISDQAQYFGSSMRTLRKLCASVISDEQLTEVVLSSDGYDEGSANHEDRRRLKRDILAARKIVKPIIVYARGAAQSYVWWDTDDDGEGRQRNRNTIKSVYASYYNIAQGSTPGSSEAMFSAAAWLDIYEAEKEVCETEKQLVSDFRFFLGVDPNNVVHLLNHMQSEDFDRDAYRPFLQFLANSVFDPRKPNVLQDHLDDIAEKPGLFITGFCSIIDQCYVGDEEVQESAIATVGAENVEWINFAHTQQVDVDAGSAGDYFRQLDDWPEPLKKCLATAHQSLLQELALKYKELLEPYIDKKSFTVSQEELIVLLENGAANMNGSADIKPSRSKRPKNGRTTLKSRAECYLPEPETDPFKVRMIAELASGPHGYILQKKIDLQAETTDVQPLAEQIRNLPSAAEYLKKQSDPKIEDDLIRMVESLLSEPYGNGASRMLDSKVSIQLEDNHRNNKSYAVWHLNPNKRSNLSVGDTGRETRIYYVPHRDKEGNFTISILRVGHKNDTSKINTSVKGN